MTMSVEVLFRDMVPLPSLEGDIRRRAQHLERYAADITRCRVVVEATANQHRQGHVYTVQIDLHATGVELVAGVHHRSEEIALAVRGAFDAMGRRLEDHVRRQRGQVKHHRRDEPGDAPVAPLDGETPGG